MVGNKRARNVRNIELTIVLTELPALLRITNHAIAGGAEQQICVIASDSSLGFEDYLEAIRRHVDVVRKHPDNALAHYHLGFALGMLSETKRR